MPAGTPVAVIVAAVVWNTGYRSASVSYEPCLVNRETTVTRRQHDEFGCDISRRDLPAVASIRHRWLPLPDHCQPHSSHRRKRRVVRLSALVSRYDTVWTSHEQQTTSTRPVGENDHTCDGVAVFSASHAVRSRRKSANSPGSTQTGSTMAAHVPQVAAKVTAKSEAYSPMRLSTISSGSNGSRSP